MIPVACTIIICLTVYGIVENICDWIDTWDQRDRDERKQPDEEEEP